MPQIHLPVEQQTDHKPVEGGNGRGLRGSHDAAVNAAQHDHRHHERPLGLPYGGAQTAQGAFLHLASPAAAAGIPPAIPHEHQAGYDARHNAAHEQVADGNLRGHAVNDKGIGRRNHHPHTPGGGHKRGGEKAIIAAFNHGRNGQRADGGHGGGAGTADGPEKHAGDNGRQPHAPVSAAHNFVSQGQQTAGKPARAHERSGGDEKGNGHDRKAVDGSKAYLRHVFNGQGIGAENGGQGSQPQTYGHGHADGAEQDKIPEKAGQRIEVSVCQLDKDAGGGNKRRGRQTRQ